MRKKRDKSGEWKNHNSKKLIDNLHQIQRAGFLRGRLAVKVNKELKKSKTSLEPFQVFSGELELDFFLSFIVSFF